MDNKQEPTQTTLGQALAALEEVTGLRATVLDPNPAVDRQNGFDARIAIQDGPRTFDLIAEVKPRIDRTLALDALRDQMHQFAGDRGVLVTHHMTNELATYCRKIQQQFIDAAGNAYLRLPGLYVQVRGQRRPPRPDATYRARPAATATGQRTIFLLLCRAEYLNAPYRDIANTAGVALGAVGPVFHDLADQKYIIGKPRNWRLLEPIRLLDHWAALYPTVLRPKLAPRRFTTDDRNWWQGATLADTGGLWGGEVAADMVTRRLRPATFTVYAPRGTTRNVLADLAQRYRWRADPNGEIEVLETFWNFAADPAYPNVVPPPLIYADLLATMDPRNREIALLLKDEVIEKALRPA